MLLIVVAAAGLLASATPSSAETRDLYRLPPEVVPSSYEIALSVGKLFNETKTFRGDAVVYFHVNATDVREIVVNVRNLTLEGVTLMENGTTLNLLEAVHLDDVFPYETATLTTSSALRRNATYVLSFANYVGLFSEGMYGFYVSSYDEGPNRTQYIAATQLEATHARRLFPCFDEPSYKATFDIVVTCPEGFEAVANTPPRKPPTTIDGYTTTEFQTTPTMSTYLVAILISKFTGLKTADERFRVLARAGANHTIEYSFNVGQSLLKTLDTLTGIPYYRNIGKLDLAAIPDFAPGAMENWGLITFRESTLLWDEGGSSKRSKQRVATVIAHELVHQWFGNLVTFDWWSSAWLNEGFATYISYLAVDDVERSWEMDKQFVLEEQQYIFPADSLSATLPLTSPVSTPDQIKDRFFSISYSKGASVIRMVRSAVGADNFLQGVRKYLVDNAMNNTTPKHLWDAIQSAAAAKLPPGKTLDMLMKNWIEKPGYPVLTVSAVDGNYLIHQERFLLRGGEILRTKWNIPISYATSAQKNFNDTATKLWFLEADPFVSIKRATSGEDDWIVLNVQETGYYRVNYSPQLWENLRKALLRVNFDGIAEVNRAQIVDDAFALAMAGQIPYKTAFDVVAFLKNDVSYYPWHSAFKAYRFLLRRVRGNPALEKQLKNYIVGQTEKLRASVPIGQIKNEHIYTYKQELALSWACDLELKDCLVKSEQMFEDYRLNNKMVDPNLRSVVYCSAIANAPNNTRWGFLLSKFLKSELASEKETILWALGCTRDEGLLNEFLTKSIDPKSGIRSQDAGSVFSSVLKGSPVGVKVAFAFFREKHPQILKRYGGWSAVSDLITELTEMLATEKEIEEFEAFYRENREGFAAMEKAIETGIENARVNLEWTKNHEEQVREVMEALPRASSAALAFNALLPLFSLAAYFLC